MAKARDAARAVPEEETPFNAQRPAQVATFKSKEKDNVPCLHRAQGKGHLQLTEEGRSDQIPGDHAPAAPSASDLPPVMSTAFTARPSQLTKSYLQAALTPAQPPPRASKPLPRLSLTDGCFRCLALDHQVRDCGDPVRCRTCHGSGHRQHRCAMLRNPSKRQTPAAAPPSRPHACPSRLYRFLLPFLLRHRPRPP